MAFNPAPNALFTSWSEDGTDITVPIASITDLTAGEADGTTGDWRAVLLRILGHSFNYNEGLADADRPTKLTIARQRFENAERKIVERYTFEFVTDTDANSMTAE